MTSLLSVGPHLYGKILDWFCLDIHFSCSGECYNVLWFTSEEITCYQLEYGIWCNIGSCINFPACFAKSLIFVVQILRLQEKRCPVFHVKKTGVIPPSFQFFFCHKNEKRCIFWLVLFIIKFHLLYTVDEFMLNFECSTFLSTNTNVWKEKY